MWATILGLLDAGLKPRTVCMLGKHQPSCIPNLSHHPFLLSSEAANRLQVELGKPNIVLDPPKYPSMGEGTDNGVRALLGPSPGC